MLSLFDMMLLIAVEQFLENKSLDFFVLITCPEESQKALIVCCSQFDVFTLLIDTKSSAKKRCEILGPLLEIFIRV